MNPGITFQLTHANVSTFAADVLVLKYARMHYGVDKLVAQELSQAGVDPARLRPAVGRYELLNDASTLCFKQILFVGVNNLSTFGYADIRDFAAQSLRILGEAYPEARHVCMTIHGIGYGLDESKALLAQVSGLLESLRRGQYPSGLQRLSIVELNEGRVQRLQAVLADFLPKEQVYPTADGRAFLFAPAPTPSPLVAPTPPPTRPPELPGPKKHIFVAMPFAKALDDTFYYGIQSPIHRNNFLCERLDHTTFVGDILARMKQQIASASAIVADLTLHNPNVYLEVGYAWALQKPTVLLIKKGSKLKFDVQGQKCLHYQSIKNLEDTLTQEIAGLVKSGVIR